MAKTDITKEIKGCLSCADGAIRTNGKEPYL